MLRSARNYLTHLFKEKPEGWYPLLSVYYLTYSCNFRCPYCCDGNNIPYYQLPREELSGEKVIELLQIIRRHCDYLVLTGGEPCLHPELDYILKELPSLNFDGVVLTSNGHDILPYLELINSSVNYLVFSLDTLDSQKADQWYGAKAGAHKRILANLEAANKFSGRDYDIIISAVAMDTNIEDLDCLLSFCKQNNYRFAVSPQLVGVKASSSLTANRRYSEFFNRLIEGKKKGAAINGTILYLEHMRDFRKFKCRPSTVLAVSPQGDVFFSCLERGHKAGNLFKEESLHHTRRLGLDRIGPEPECDNRCHSPCALGLSLALNHPTSVLFEGFFLLKHKLGSHL